MTTKRIKQSTVEASEWFAALRAGELTHSERERFVNWLRESPAHVEEYLEHADLWEDMGQAAQLLEMDVNALLADGDNVVTIPDRDVASGDNTATLSAQKRKWLRLRHLATAASLLVAVAMVWWFVSDHEPNNVMTTAIGEQRSITLEDGSVVSLNTQTSIRVTLSPAERRVDLLQGEALFDIARDEDWPFIVIAGDTQVRVLGTTFNVYRQNDAKATVTVLEGRVAVSRTDDENAYPAINAVETRQPGSPRGDGALASLELTEGQQVSIERAGSVIAPQPANLEKAIAWTERRLIFEDTTLAEVVTEFNRYNTRELRVDDPALAAVRLNAVFEAHDPDSLIEFLQRSKGVRVRDAGSQRILVPQQL